MAKHSYMIKEDYVRGWRVRDAFRELIANAIDAEQEHGAAASVTHTDTTLKIRNIGTRLDIHALYLGGTSKTGSTSAIGQYGEGLKLALLVLVRNNMPVRLENDDEVWTPVLEPDQNGVRALAINTRAKRVPSGNVEITIENVSEDLYYEACLMFLRLQPPKNKIPTSAGEILLDADRLGHLYVRGVYITKLPEALAGYNIQELEVSRDRRSYDTYELTRKIQQMWAEAATRPEAARSVFDGFMNGAQDLQGASWLSNEALTASMVDVFHARYGESALPITSTGEGVELEHLGASGVVVPPTLAAVLRRTLPTVASFRAEQERKITQRFAPQELRPAERQLLQQVLSDLEAIGCSVGSRTTVVTFGSPSVEGLHDGEQLLLARSCLQSYGKTAGVLLHEAAHDSGPDASKAHVDQIHKYMEALLTRLAEQRR